MAVGYRFFICFAIAFCAMKFNYADSNSGSFYAEPICPENDDTSFEVPDTLLDDPLYALGYFPGRNTGPTKRGIVTINDSLVKSGYNFVISPHKTGAYLMDNNGIVLHEWSHNLWEAWSEDELPDFVKIQKDISYNYWGRAKLLNYGDLVFIHKGCGLFRMDKNSNIKWVTWTPAHHDFEILSNGNLLCLTRSNSIVDESKDNNEDLIIEVNSEGKILRELSIDKALENSPFAYCRDSSVDYLHTNELVVLDMVWAKQLNGAKPGDVLISCRNINTLFVVNLDTKSIVWAMRGEWVRQHGPVLLDSGSILLFDNLGNSGSSRVLEFNPVSAKIHWKYEGCPRTTFATEVGGYVQRLENGNTLITESTKGRAFEVTGKGEIVWEYLNPASLASNQGKISPIFLVHRYSSVDFLVSPQSSGLEMPILETPASLSRNAETSDE